MPRKLTQDEFLARAKSKFSSYDFSQTVYKDSSTKVTIICPIHGPFSILPSKLISKIGQGCPICGRKQGISKQTKTTAEFIDEAKIKFPRFDYSEVKYIDARTNVTIICKKHNRFQITPDSFLRSKYGCNECAKENNAKSCRLTQEEFIEKAQNRHPDLDFSKSVYKKATEKVLMICRKHNPSYSFYRRANDVLSGGGCPKCGIIIRNEKKRKQQEDFIREAFLKFPRFDYSKVEYKGSDKEVTIICPTHGEFHITPDSLLGNSKHGCQICAKEAIGNSLRFTQEEYIKRAKKVFSEYDYSKVIYHDQLSKITVICPEHKDFIVTAGNLLVGHGCPICKYSKGELAIRNWLIDNKINYEAQKKFKELGNLSYDFFIPERNLLIEFNGEQHYGIVPFYHSKNRPDKNGVMGLRIQFQNDMIKEHYAIENGFNLLIIPYWDYDKIKEILEERITKNVK